MIKTFIGFSGYRKYNINIISTGNWGCGMFGGNPQFKCILQWIIASILNKKIVYYPFKDKRMIELDKIINQIKSKNPSLINIIKILISYDEHIKTIKIKENRVTFFKLLLNKL